jgi:hypothetical protein
MLPMRRTVANNIWPTAVSFGVGQTQLLAVTLSESDTSLPQGPNGRGPLPSENGLPVLNGPEKGAAAGSVTTTGSGNSLYVSFLDTTDDADIDDRGFGPLSARFELEAAPL